MSKEVVLQNEPAEEPVANRFTPDAKEWSARLRALADEFPNEADPKPLTQPEIRLARQTSVAALEKAALFAEAAPGVGSVADVAEIRDVIAFEIAFGGVREEALNVARTVDHAILRRKLKVVKVVRGLYRMAKGYVTLDEGDAVRLHVDAMKRSLTRPRRKVKPPASPADPPAKKK